ncbi:terminase, partial [Acinetobacter nosocomialis]
ERQIYDDYGQPDKSAGFDHMNDAGTYPIAYLFPIDKKSVGVRRIRGMS